MKEFDGLGDQLTWGKLKEYSKLLREYAQLQTIRAPEAELAKVRRRVEQEKEFTGELLDGSDRGFNKARLNLHETSTRRLQQVLRMYKEWVDEIPTDLNEPEFAVWRRHLQKVINELNELLATRGEDVPGQAVITQATSAAKVRAEIILRLKQTADELKQQFPSDTWPDIDREIRKAIDKVRRES